MIPSYLNFVYFVLAILVTFGSAIAGLKLLFAIIYATGNKNDQLLLELMKRQGISKWKALQTKSGLSNAGLWLLRDGEVAQLKWGELSQVAKVLCLPLPIFLEKLDLIGENPQLEACRKECSQLENQLRQLATENQNLRMENFTNMVEVD